MFKKIVISFAASMVLATGLSLAGGRNWQQSTTTQTTLWVRDKNLGSAFIVTFKVTMPDGKVLEVNVPSGKGDNSDHAELLFPQAFGIPSPPPKGKYHWDGSVDGKVVASDDFYR